METLDLCLFNPQFVRWRLEGVVIRGGTPVRGAPALGLTDGGGFWLCEMSGVSIRGREGLRAARAFEARMDSGATKLIVPDRDRHLGPGTDQWSVQMNFASPAALRATVLQVENVVGLPLVGGEHFSVDHPSAGRRMYRVASAGALTDGIQEIVIRPPLRQAVTSEELDFNSPSCTMRLVNASDFFAAIDKGRRAEANPVFVEAF